MVSISSENFPRQIQIEKNMAKDKTNKIIIMKRVVVFVTRVLLSDKAKNEYMV